MKHSDALPRIPQSRVRRELNSLMKKKKPFVITNCGRDVRVMVPQGHPVYEMALARQELFAASDASHDTPAGNK